MIASLVAMMLQASQPAYSEPEAHISWTPSREYISKFYPKRAWRRAIEGSAEVRCVVSADGRPEGCQAVKEAPEGFGFGDAAVQMVGHFEVGSSGTKLPPQGATVRIRINFHMWITMRSGLIQVPSAALAGQQVEVNCRYENLRLDSCYAVGGAAVAEGTADAAVKVAQSLSMRRAYPPVGRMVFPIRFVAPSAAK